VHFEVSVSTISHLETAQKGRGTEGSGSGEETDSSWELGGRRRCLAQWLQLAAVAAGCPGEGDDGLGQGGPKRLRWAGCQMGCALGKINKNDKRWAGRDSWAKIKLVEEKNRICFVISLQQT
jgi:hypothetical protein